jgi:hypothetical protein
MESTMEDDKEPQQGLKRNTSSAEESSSSVAVSKRSVRRKYLEETVESVVVDSTTTNSEYYQMLFRVLNSFFLKYRAKNTNFIIKYDIAADVSNEQYKTFMTKVEVLLDPRMILYAKDLFYSHIPLGTEDQVCIKYDEQTNAESILESIREFFNQRSFFSIEYAKLIVDAMERRADENQNQKELVYLKNFLVNVDEDSTNIVVDFANIRDLMSTPLGRKHIWRQRFPRYPFWDKDNEEEGNEIYLKIKDYYIRNTISKLSLKTLSNGAMIHVWKEKIDKMIEVSRLFYDHISSEISKKELENNVDRLNRYKPRLDLWGDSKIQAIIEMVGMCYDYIEDFSIYVLDKSYTVMLTELEKCFNIASQTLSLDVSEVDLNGKLQGIIYCQQLYQFHIKFGDPSKYEPANFLAGMKGMMINMNFEDIQLYHKNLQTVCEICEISYDLSRGYKMINDIKKIHNSMFVQLKLDTLPTYALSVLGDKVEPNDLLNQWEQTKKILTQQIENLVTNSTKFCHGYNSAKCGTLTQIVTTLVSKSVTYRACLDIIKIIPYANTLANEVEKERSEYDTMVKEVRFYRSHITDAVNADQITIENWLDIKNQIDARIEIKYNQLIKVKYNRDTALQTALKILEMAKHVADIIYFNRIKMKARRRFY